jgi:hypothetical protein
MPKKGFRHSEISKERMRISAIGNSEGGMTGKHHSPESNERNRQSHLGKIPWNGGRQDPNAKRNQPKSKGTKEPKIVSEATRKKLSDSHKGKTSPRKGHHHTEETKKKLSISHTLPEDKKPRVIKICKGCGITFKVTPSRDGYGWGLFHSKACRRAFETGQNSPQWKGGISPLHKVIRMSQEMVNWRMKVFERDNYQDWFSGCSGDIVAHHIKKFSQIIKENKITTFEEALACPELWDINNGMTMLRVSHRAHHEMWGW